MVDFVNKLELSDQKYHTNDDLRYKYYKGKYLFTMRDFVKFGTYLQSMFYTTNRFSKENIDSVYFRHFNWITFAKRNTLHKNLVKMFCDVHYMW